MSESEKKVFGNEELEDVNGGTIIDEVMDTMDVMDVMDVMDLGDGVSGPFVIEPTSHRAPKQMAH